MFFRTLLTIGCILTLSSCSWIRDQPKDSGDTTRGGARAFKSESLNLDCLQIMPTQLQFLFNGQYTDSAADREQISQIWRCLDKSLSVFGTRVIGKTPGVYTAVELRRFANKYLPPDHQFTPELTDSIFRLKKAVLGGSDTEITTGDLSEKDNSEIKRLKQKLNRFGEIIVPLAPYLSTLLGSTNEQSNERIKAGQLLSQFIADFVQILEDSRNPLLWTDLGSFVYQLEIYTKKGSPSALTVIREQIPLYQYVKLLLVGGNETLIENSKWRPIFTSISSFYNAIYVTSNPSQQLDQLNLDIQSSDSDQRRATEKITGLLRILKDDQSIYSHKSIEVLADRWAKVLLLNNFLFPKSQGSLALREFLKSDDLRRSAGYIIDGASRLKTSSAEPGLIKTMTYLLKSLIKGSADRVDIPGEPVTIISVSALQHFAIKLHPLFSDKSELDMIQAGLDALKNLSAILVGKNGDRLTHVDVENLIQKLSDLYITLVSDKPKKDNLPDLLSKALDIILGGPSAPYSITLSQIQGTMDDVQKILKILSLETRIEWRRYQDYVNNGFRLKNLLYGKSDNTLYVSQLKEIQKGLEPFRETDDLSVSLKKLAEALDSNFFADHISLTDLLNGIDFFLPENRKISSFGLDSDEIGLLKSILLGGPRDQFSKKEFPELARIASSANLHLVPVFKGLPENFKIGLNSQTFSLTEELIRSLVEGKKETIKVSFIEELLYLSLRKSGKPVSHDALFKALKGILQRVLTVNPELQKAPKTTTVPVNLPPLALAPMLDVLEQGKKSLLDIESAFTDVAPKNSQPKDLLEKRLTQDENKALLKHLQPIMDGRTGFPHLEANGGRDTQYFFDDLVYKAVIYDLLGWVFSHYQIEKDNTQATEGVRLSYNNLVDVLSDFNDLIYEMGLAFIRDTPQASAKRRMQTINLFMQTGNGDDYIDLMETTEFLTMSVAGKPLLDKVRKDLVASCFPIDTNYETVEEINYKCINSTFFTNDFFTKIYQSVAPQLVEDFLKFSPEERDGFRKSALTAADPKWTDTGKIDLDKLETLVSIPYYSENIFERMDTNFNGILEFSEAMGAFPIFCGEIKKAGGQSLADGDCSPGQDPGYVEAVYGYLLFHGTPPDLTGRFIPKLFKEGKFWNWARNWKKFYRNTHDADFRILYRKDLLSIISNLSTSISPPTPPPEAAVTASGLQR